jgi:hypothetical protein
MSEMVLAVRDRERDPVRAGRPPRYLARKGSSPPLSRPIPVISLMIPRALPTHCLNAGAGRSLSQRGPPSARPAVAGPPDEFADPDDLDHGRTSDHEPSADRERVDGPG